MNDASDQAIERFWLWWPSIAKQLATSPNSPLEALCRAIEEHVHAIHEKLSWTTGPGDHASHHFALSARGDLVLRAVTESWLAHAPAGDADWEFRAARQPRDVSDESVSVGERSLTLDPLRASVREDESRQVVDVVLYHPEFGDIEEALRARVAFVGLDAALGEDNVERWIGTVATAVEPLDEPTTLSQLATTVSELAERASGEHWTAVRGDVDGKPMIGTVNRAIKSLDHLSLDAHIRIDIPLDHANERGLAGSQESFELHSLERNLIETLAGHGVLIARETNRGHRVLHFHADASAGAIVDTWKRQSPRNIAVLSSPDPNWDILRRWG
jgi:hypothetical protein